MVGRVDRWLVAMVGGAVVLVVAGFALLMVVQARTPETLPEDSPAGVVQRYLRALEEGRYEDAEAYLSESVKARREKEEQAGRPRPVKPSGGERPSTRVVLQDVQTRDDSAQVTVAISSFSAPSPTEAREYSTPITFELRRQQGTWKIIAPDYPYFFPY